MSFLSNISLDTPGLALYAIPAAFFVGLAPHVHKMLFLQSAGIKTDNRSPRASLELAEKKGIPAPALSKANRLAAAHQNATENFPIFLGAVLSGVGAGLPWGTVNGFAAGYLGLRVVYHWAYANQSTQAVAGVRSLAFWAATGWAFWVMIQAGNVLVKKGI